MKVIIKEWKNGCYIDKDSYVSKKEFIETHKTAFSTDGMEHLSWFERCLLYYIGGNGNLKVIVGSKYYDYKNGHIREFKTDGTLIRKF